MTISKIADIERTDILDALVNIYSVLRRLLADFMDSQLGEPMAFKIDSTGRPVYQSHNDFGPLRSLRSIPQLVDFGLATRLEEDDDWGIWPIQPDHYRAPEVILGNGWQMPADIWSLGALVRAVVLQSCCIH